MSGFYIKSLKVVGTGKEDAEITFQKGLNVIHGPSNTGKSYVFQCIDYAFGADKIKNIPESEGYSKLYIEIRNFDNDSPITILRFLNSKDIFYCECSIDQVDNHNFKNLKSRHDPNNEDNISKFLLKHIGIDGNKYLVKNRFGEKVTLGFRSIVHLTMISETDIISEVKSPVLDNQRTQQTYSKSVFRYLLTNQDDIALIELEKPEIKKVKNDAKIDYIKEEVILLTQEKEELIEDKSSYNDEDIYNLDYYKDKIADIEKVIKFKRKELHDINTYNDKLNLQRNKTKMMIEKFSLLKEQYLSDIERLEFSSNGGDLLSQISTHYCPLCNSAVPIDTEAVDQDDIISCSYNEKVKIQINLSELEDSISDLTEELCQINGELTLGEKKAKKYNEEITKISTKDLNPLRVVINVLIEKAKIDIKIVNIGSTIERKNGEIITFEESKKVKEDFVTDGLIIDQQIYTDLCTVIKNSLITCGYSEVEEVTFDVKTQDIEIDGVHRLSNGKGYRAFFYSIFSAALMIYLQNIESCFMRVLVLDSPLTTLKESEGAETSEGDFVDSSLQDGLFSFFSDEFADKQVIIIENKQPPKSLSGKYNDITFTKGRSEGRYGFFKEK